MERHASDNVDFCTRSDPLLTVPCTLYLLLDQLASGLLGLDGRYVVNKVDHPLSSQTDMLQVKLNPEPL
jgi:hypothetical protein